MKNKLRFIDGSTAFMISAILFIAANIFMQLNFKYLYKNMSTWNMVPQVIVNELLILLPAVIIVLFKKENFKNTFRLNKISLKQIGLCFVLFLATLIINAFLSSLVILVLKVIGVSYVAQNIPSPTTSNELLLASFFVAIVPAFFEDMFFRGFLLRSCERHGRKFAIFCSAFCFALMHVLNGYVFFNIFYVGIILALAVYYTNSIWAGVFIHFCNNFAGVIVKYIYAMMSKSGMVKAMNKETVAAAVNPQYQTIIIQVLVMGALAIGAAYITKAVIDVLKEEWKSNKGPEIENQVTEKEYRFYKIFNIPITVTIIMFVVVANLRKILLLLKIIK